MILLENNLCSVNSDIMIACTIYIFKVTIATEKISNGKEEKMIKIIGIIKNTINQGRLSNILIFNIVKKSKIKYYCMVLIFSRIWTKNK